MNERGRDTMKLELAVINGLVFIEGGFRKADVGISNGKIAMVTEPEMCIRDSLYAERAGYR